MPLPWSSKRGNRNIIAFRVRFTRRLLFPFLLGSFGFRRPWHISLFWLGIGCRRVVILRYMVWPSRWWLKVWNKRRVLIQSNWLFILTKNIFTSETVIYMSVWNQYYKLALVSDKSVQFSERAAPSLLRVIPEEPSIEDSSWIYGFRGESQTVKSPSSAYDKGEDGEGDMLTWVFICCVDLDSKLTVTGKDEFKLVKCCRLIKYI